MSKIGIIGNGFVGSAILHGFILHVDDIMIYDKDPKLSTHQLGKLASDCEVLFVCVPTPMFESGECDLSIVESVVDEVCACSFRKPGQVIVVKSTVVPGTVERLARKYPDVEAIEGDWEKAIEGFITDGRIGNSHIDVPGHDGDMGFGGKCFPKDLNAMIKRAEALGVNPCVMKGAWQKNKEVRTDLDWYDIPGAVSSKED